MADNVWTILIRDEQEDVSGVPVATPEGVTGKAPTSNTVSQEQAKGNNAAGLVAAQRVEPYINQTVNFGVAQIGTVRGSPELQQRLQMVTGATGTVANAVFAFSAGGPTGLGVYAVTAIVGKAVSTAYKIQEINNQRLIENETLSYRKSRMGQSVNRSRFGGVV